MLMDILRVHSNAPLVLCYFPVTPRTLDFPFYARGDVRGHAYRVGAGWDVVFVRQLAFRHFVQLSVLTQAGFALAVTRH